MNGITTKWHKKDILSDMKLHQQLNVNCFSLGFIYLFILNNECVSLEEGGLTRVIVIHFSVQFGSPDESRLHHLHLHGLHLLLHAVKLGLVVGWREIFNIYSSRFFLGAAVQREKMVYLGGRRSLRPNRKTTHIHQSGSLK